MNIVSGKILYLNSNDLLPQFKDSDFMKVSFAKMNMDVIKEIKNMSIIIFIDDRKHMDSVGRKKLMKS